MVHSKTWKKRAFELDLLFKVDIFQEEEREVSDKNEDLEQIFKD